MTGSLLMLDARASSDQSDEGNLTISGMYEQVPAEQPLGESVVDDLGPPPDLMLISGHGPVTHPGG
jgi:hypothetical protein